MIGHPSQEFLSRKYFTLRSYICISKITYLSLGTEEASGLPRRRSVEILQCCHVCSSIVLNNEYFYFLSEYNVAALVFVFSVYVSLEFKSILPKVLLVR